MHNKPCTRTLGRMLKSRRIWPLFCIGSTLKKKTFYGTNKNKAQSLGPEADKCQMCTTKGALVLKADQLQKMNWLCFSDPPTSPQNTWCGLQLCRPISEYVFLSFVLTKKKSSPSRETRVHMFHVGKIKRGVYAGMTVLQIHTSLSQDKEGFCK